MPRISNHHSDLDPQQLFSCGRESCDAVFTRSSDRNRHEKKHVPYSKRPFKCQFCDFRANQKIGLSCHENSVHFKKRIPCRYPGCDRDFSDPSTLSRHMNKQHKLSSKKLRFPSWVDLTSRFHSASDPVDATAAHTSGGIRKFGTDGDKTTRIERRSPDVSSANVTLHTSLVGRQEGSSQNPLLDSALFSFAPSPSPTLTPPSGSVALHQPYWQFQAPSSLYPSGSDSSCSTDSLPALSLPKTNLTTMPPCGFQVDFGMPDAYGTPSKPAEQFVDPYFQTLDDFLVQSVNNSSFSMTPNLILPVPSVMEFPPMTNYDATCFGIDFRCDASQNWQVDTPALNFGYDDTEYYPNFNGLSF